MKLGGHNLLIANPRDFPGFVAELAKHRFTFFSGVNTLFNALLHTPGFDSLDFSALRVSLGGGMAVQAAVAERWKAVTGNVLTQAWGLTETSPAACINRPGDDFNGSIGLPIPSTIITIRDDAGNELPLGQSGEICVEGPQVMRGYWNRQDETDEGHAAGARVAHGRSRFHRSAGVRVHRGSQERHDPRLGFQRVPERGREASP